MTIDTYSISNQVGDSLLVTNYGARLLSWFNWVEDQPRNIIVGYHRLEDYLTDKFFMGAIVGPYANRIAHGRCLIDQQSVQLDTNEEPHHLHGGTDALANQYWTCIHHTDNSVTLGCELADQFNGYPGAINVEASYRISGQSELTVAIKVVSERTTLAGPTAHPYFNLGPDSDFSPHYLQLFSKHYTPHDSGGIPDGSIRAVAGTHYDYTKSRLIDNSTTLDDNFLLSRTDSTISSTLYKHAILQSYDKVLALHIASNYPALQVYTGQYLRSPFTAGQGVCLEPQFSPDSPNQTDFPFHVTTPQNALETVISYRLENRLKR